MDGRGQEIDGRLAASRPAARVEDTSPNALPYTIAFVQFRIAPYVDVSALSTQYAGDTVVTSPVAAVARGLDPESHEKQNVSRSCCGPSGMTRENGKLYLRSWPMTGVIRAEGWGVAVGSRNTGNPDGYH